MQWFQHDSDSTQDAKIKKLLIRHGAVGYAVYFHCLELIASEICETNLTFELEHDSEIIADNLKIAGTGEKSGRDIVEEIMRTIIELDLFSETEGHVFCFKLLKRINLSQTSNPSFRAMITDVKAKYHDGIMTNHDGIMRHYPPTIPTLPTNTTKKDRLPLESLAMAELLYTLHQSEIDKGYCPDAKAREKWADDIEKLNRIDARSWEDIEKVIRWVKRGGQFWAGNIMSGKKLREKFPTLYAQMIKPSGNAPRVLTRTASLDMEG